LDKLVKCIQALGLGHCSARHERAASISGADCLTGRLLR